MARKPAPRRGPAAISRPYGPAPGSAYARLGELIGHAFGVKPADGANWLRDSVTGGRCELRTLGGGSPARPDACLSLIPMGQFFGGRSVPMVGVAGVAVAPEARGQGLARRLMAHAVTELAERRVPLSTLYASTQALYRQSGYEAAGHRGVTSVPIEHIDVRERAAPGERWEVLTPAQQRLIEPVYARWAAAHDGMLDRGRYVWARVWKWREREATVFAAMGAGPRPGGVEAYVALATESLPSRRLKLVVADAAWTTPRGLRRLWGFLHDYASMADAVVLSGGPAHPMLWPLAQQRWSYEFKDLWMLRLCHLPAAIAARSYWPGVSGRVRLVVDDAVVPANAGAWELRVEGGTGELRRPAGARSGPRGDGEVRCGINALAAIYSGLATPAALRLAGLLEGDAEAVERLGGLMASRGAPAMTDFF